MQTKNEPTPSVRTILDILRGHTPMTGKQLREESGLPRRTVYTALRRLREMGLLKERPSLRDSRQTYFWVVDANSAQGERGGAGADRPPRPASMQSNAPNSMSQAAPQGNPPPASQQRPSPFQRQS